MAIIENAVFCRTQFEGIHCWPNAPQEVYYLRSPHRHIFNIEVQIDVETNDREIEFIMLKHEVDCWINNAVVAQKERTGRVWDLGSTSCECLANSLANFLHAKYQYRNIYIEVNEDGENGARLWLHPDQVDEGEDLDDLLEELSDDD